MDAVQETFVDAFGEISFKHGMIRIELVSLSGAEPRVTQRLITSLQAFQQMVQAQNGMLQQLEKAGVVRPAGPHPHPNPPPQAGQGTGGGEANAGTAGGGVVAAVRRLARIEPVPNPAPVSNPAPRPAPEL